MTLPESITRPTRTAGQGAAAYAAVEFVDSWLYDMTDRQYAALVVALTIIIGWAQVAIEDWRGKAILRDVQAPGR